MTINKRLINVFKKMSVEEVITLSQSWQLVTESDDEI